VNVVLFRDGRRTVAHEPGEREFVHACQESGRNSPTA
jgi:hypothetical protein